MAKLTSSETIANLSVLLDAIRAHKKPKQEAELYAKRKLIDLNAEKELFKWKRDLDKVSGPSVALVSKMRRSDEGQKAEKGLRKAEKFGAALEKGQVTPGKAIGKMLTPGVGQSLSMLGVVNQTMARRQMGKKTVNKLTSALEAVDDTFARDAATMVPGDALWKEYQGIYARNKALLESVVEHRDDYSNLTNKRLDQILTNSAYSMMEQMFEGGEY